MDEFRRCGPWRDTTLGRVRHCQDRRLHATLDADTPGGEQNGEPEPLPERKEPPACERMVITDRTNEAARKLIESVFSEGEPS